MAQQTAVDWLVKELGLEEFIATVEFAKEKEKQEIMNAYNDGADHMVESKYEGMDNYYKLRYGSNN